MSYYNRNTIAHGGEISHIDGWTIHTFKSSGNLFVESVGIASAESQYLVVAGGGAGGFAPSPGEYNGGGGGAGGMREGNYKLTSNTNYLIIVGAGGASQTFETYNDGFNSRFSDIISNGGGAGASVGPSPGSIAVQQYAMGHAGGSGGGSSWGSQDKSPLGNIPQVDPPQGNPGGRRNFAGTDYIASAGGGGAGTAGTPGPLGPTDARAGPGGAGRASNITGILTYYAGGGGGAGRRNTQVPSPSVFFPAASGGLGGGGDGALAGPPAIPAVLRSANSGVQFTGGGGGGGTLGGPGSPATSLGASGGSGIVIVRVPFLSPRFSITENANTLLSDTNVSFNVFATNISNNYVLNYRTTGNIVSSDFLEGNTGILTIVNNLANIILTPNISESKSFSLEIFDSNFEDNVVVTSNVIVIIV